VCLLALTLHVTSAHAASSSGAPLLARRQLIAEGGKRLTRSSGAAEPYGPAPTPLDPSLPAWEQLKDRHAGQECLFIGNGPSLNKLDWSFLSAARLPVVMGVNKIYLGFERFNLRINYLACTNRRILTPDQSLEARAFILRRCDAHPTTDSCACFVARARRRFRRRWTAAW
jgi:hypothetical protein